MSGNHTIDLINRYAVDRLKNVSQQFLPVALFHAMTLLPFRVGGASVLLLGRDYTKIITSMIASHKAAT